MPINAHILCSCGSNCMSGDQTMLRMVSSGDWYSARRPPLTGAPRPDSTASRSASSRCKSSWMARCESASAAAPLQSSTKRCASNLRARCAGRAVSPRARLAESAAQPVSSSDRRDRSNELRVRMADLRVRRCAAVCALLRHVGQSEIWTVRPLAESMPQRNAVTDAPGIRPVLSRCPFLRSARRALDAADRA